MSEAFDEDWVRHHIIFTRLCRTYFIRDGETFDVIRLTKRSTSLNFYDD